MYTSNNRAHLIHLITVHKHKSTGAKVPRRFAHMSESSVFLSLLGMRVPGNKSAKERRFQGTKVPENDSPIYGTFVPGNESSLV